MRQAPAYCALVILTAIAGCGQIAIKRGSGADALAADRASCREQNADPDAVRACLVAHGWHITDLNAAPATPPPAPAAKSNVRPPPLPEPKEIHVGSWWHFGGGPADLHAAVDACVARLGPGEMPDAGYHNVSRALYACLSAAGWRRLGSGP